MTNAARQIAEQTVDAYSRDRYTDAGWRRIAQVLLDAGATPAEAEWILNSKHTRWAGDAANKNRGVTAADFEAYTRLHLKGGMARLLDEARSEVNAETRRAL